MSVAIITGSAGLVGSAACQHFAAKGMSVVGIDNDMRSWFFGDEASTHWNTLALQKLLGKAYTHESIDIRDRDSISTVFQRYGRDISLVIHAAAQPSHDWAATNPLVDFDINAAGTLNVLEATRLHAPDAVFIFTSTNKVYGDRPNELPLEELATRYEIDPRHAYVNGISEDMPIDACLHSVFGASKVAADVMVQEYGRYFGLRTACFRGGTLTGENHSATQLHGFLAYLMRCLMTGTPYTVFGYKGKQVRDAIHSSDLVRAFDEFYKAPRVAEIYNIGGGRFSHCSVLEAIDLCEGIVGHPLTWSYDPTNRVGDHIWWVGNNAKFQSHYPEWQMQYDVPLILKEIFESNRDRWKP
jgi:CDP-paratose 2-epimerase